MFSKVKIGIGVATIVVASLFIAACNKWKDPAPYTDPRLTNPYCNDPEAVNYNWGFPGKPDNTVCFYPTDVFRGTYVLTDSVYQTSTGFLLYGSVDTIQIYALSHTKLAILGLCNGGDSLKLTAGLTMVARVDTTVGDTTVLRWGQLLCRTQDTVSGTVTFSTLDSLLHFTLDVVSDTGTTQHLGKAKKL